MIIALDPGPTQTGFVQFDGGRVVDSGTSQNAHILERLRVLGGYARLSLHPPVTLAVERFEARGMAIGDESVQTILWTGRFVQAWHSPDEVRLVKRSAVKLHLCGTARAKDANVRAALLDRFGGKELAIGRKATPGPLYGVSSHAWAALGVAVTAAEAA